MKILIEGEKYSIELLETIFDDSKFYFNDGLVGIITSVGYYYSYKSGKITYMLPKVFMLNSKKTVFGISKDNLLKIDKINIAHKKQFKWIRLTSVFFYHSLVQYKHRNRLSTIINNSSQTELISNLNDKEYSYLDLVLAFVNFYKKNKNILVYRKKELKSKQSQKTIWSKTVRKSLPLLTQKNEPIYSVYRNKRKVVNTEEELLRYFYSILHHMNNEHNLYLKIDNKSSVIKGIKFKQLQKNGLKKLRLIKHKYFNDSLKKVFNLCQLYFSNSNASVRKRRDEFISIRNYNLVFEDMIDILFSDKIDNQGMLLKKIKNNDDGKIIDHIFDYKSLIDKSSIYYIGDSKYYKSGNFAGKLSKYKQFTYAKNVIQYNIDLLNEKNKDYTYNIRYRDPITDGYNITPNFFIYGYISDYNNFETDDIQESGDIVKSFHFKERLFDRDTLFIHQYKINFLFVLKAYSTFGQKQIENFRRKIKTEFRKNFVNFFNHAEKSGFTLYRYKKNDQAIFVESNFRQIAGKSFITLDGSLLLAKHSTDSELSDLLTDFDRFYLE